MRKCVQLCGIRTLHGRRRTHVLSEARNKRVGVCVRVRVMQEARIKERVSVCVRVRVQSRKDEI